MISNIHHSKNDAPGYHTKNNREWDPNPPPVGDTDYGGNQYITPTHKWNCQSLFDSLNAF